MRVLGRSNSNERLNESKRTNSFPSDNEMRVREQGSRYREDNRSKERDYDNRQREDDRKSTVSRRSSRSANRPKKNIIGMNTFKEASPHKYLHFFQNDENILHYLDL